MKKILSIDGGGIRGVMPASFLATVEESLGQPVIDYFDLVVGTSTGGIVALGLAAGISPAEIRRLYIEHGESIFRGPRLPRAVRQWALGKYDATGLRRALQGVFGSRRLGESTTRVVVPAVNIESGEVHIYKTAHHPRFERDFKERIVDVAMATAAAPTYLPTHLTEGGIPLVDGGVFANNPAGLAAVEAIGVLEWTKNDVLLLSLGSGSEALKVGWGRRRNLGRLYWATKLAAVFMSAQSSSSIGTAQLLLGHANLHRVSPVVPQGRFGLDVMRELPSLRGIGEAEARKALPALRQRFFDAKAEPFISHRELDAASTL